MLNCLVHFFTLFRSSLISKQTQQSILPNHFFLFFPTKDPQPIQKSTPNQRVHHPLATKKKKHKSTATKSLLSNNEREQGQLILLLCKCSIYFRYSKSSFQVDPMLKSCPKLLPKERSQFYHGCPEINQHLEYMIIIQGEFCIFQVIRDALLLRVLNW